MQSLSVLLATPPLGLAGALDLEVSPVAIASERGDLRRGQNPLLCQFELLVAEVGDELEGSAQCGDEPAQRVLGGDLSAFDLGDPRD